MAAPEPVVRLASIIQASARVPPLQLAKLAAAAALAWAIPWLLFPGQVPVFAVVAALLVVQPSVNQSLGKAVERSVGVVIGVVLAYVVRLVFGDASWVVLVAILIAILAGWALRLTAGSASQVPITAMLVLALGGATPTYAVERIVETLIGAAIGFAINVIIVPPVLVKPAHESLVLLGDSVATSFERLAAALVSPQTSAQREELLIESRLLRPMAEKASAAVAKADETLIFNPRSGRHRGELERDSRLLVLLDRLSTRARLMVRTFHDHYDDQLSGEPTVAAIAEELNRAAHDLRGRVHADAEQPAADEPPSLTSPLAIAAPHPEHWVLIGSLLEDLRRIHEEITDDE